MQVRQDFIDNTHKLFQAIEDQDFALVKKAVSLGIDLSIEKKMRWNNQTVMQFASEKKYFYFIQYIVKNINADAEDKYCYTEALLAAVKSRNLECANALLKAGASQKKKEDSYTTPLHAAVKNNDLDMVTLLLSFGGDLAIKNFRDKTPMELAAYNQYSDIVKFIAEKKVTDENDSYHFNQALIHSVRDDNQDCVKALLDGGASINHKDFDGNSPLHIAARYGLTDMLEFLLKRGGNVLATNSDGNTLLHEAAEGRSNNEVVKILSYRVCSLLAVKNNKGLTPIESAALERNFSFVKYIARNYIDVWGGYHFGGALYAAVQQKEINCAILLLKKNASHVTWIGTETRDSLLHIAAYNNDMEMYKLLLSYGCDLSAKNTNDQTPIQVASSKKHFSIVKYTADKYRACDISVFEDEEGKMVIDYDLSKPDRDYGYIEALHDAIVNGEYRCAKSLLAAGTYALRWERNKFDRRTLMLAAAAETNQLDMIELLLRYVKQLPWYSKEYEIHEAVKIALKKKYFDCIKLIVDAHKSHCKSYQAALILSIANNKMECMESLLGAISQEYLSVALPVAAGNNNSRAVFWLLSYGADPLDQEFSHEARTFISYKDKYPQFFANGWFENQCYMYYAAIAIVLIQGARQSVLPYNMPVDVLQRIMLEVARINNIPFTNQELVKNTNQKMQALPIECFSSAIKQAGFFKTTQGCRKLASDLESDSPLSININQHIHDYLMIDSKRPQDTLALLQKYRLSNRDEIDSIQIKCKRKEECDAMIAKKPDSDAYYLRACFYHSYSYVKEAFADYVKAINLDKNNFLAGLNLSKLLLDIVDMQKLQGIDKKVLWNAVNKLAPKQQKELLDKCLDQTSLLYAYLYQAENGLLNMFNMNTGRSILEEMEKARVKIVELSDSEEDEEKLGL